MFMGCLSLMWLCSNISVLCTGFFVFSDMDFRAKDKAWLGQIDQVFGSSGIESQLSEDHSLDSQALEIEKLLLKRTKIWWNRAFLEKYVSSNMIPRGLRVRVTPSFPIEDDDFIKRWEEACGTCSLIFMKLLIERNSKIIVDLDKTIDDIERNFKAVCASEKIAAFESRIEKNLDLCVKKINETQASKFQRDIKDFANKGVYFWRKPNSKAPGLRGVSSVGSLSSMSDSSEWSTSSITTRSGSRPKRVRDVNFHPYKRMQFKSPERKKSNKVINLSSHVLTDSDLSLLSRGLTFSPKSHFNTFMAIKDLHLFARSLIFKKHFFDPDLQSLFPTEKEQLALQDLEDLSTEHEFGEGEFSNFTRLCFNLWKSFWPFHIWIPLGISSLSDEE
ncbi:uncharacterized protein [Dendrobates tinctorius]|uniref:uncharacterized protein n=1 Tax=Dendrobates tinctorius TaxID=92724 RepID=UPI003CCA3153